MVLDLGFGGCWRAGFRIFADGGASQIPTSDSSWEDVDPPSLSRDVDLEKFGLRDSEEVPFCW